MNFYVAIFIGLLSLVVKPMPVSAAILDDELTQNYRYCPYYMPPALETVRDYSVDSTCFSGTDDSACDNCYDMVSTVGGVVATTTKRIHSYLDGTVIRCGCAISFTTYECVSGYYGTATGLPLVGQDSTECIACPDNATCAGGNDSTFVCDSGYIKTDTACIRCAVGTYNNGSECVDCPGRAQGAVSALGATSVSACYIPGTVGIEDERGTYTFGTNCYYSTTSE